MAHMAELLSPCTQDDILCDSLHTSGGGGGTGREGVWSLVTICMYMLTSTFQARFAKLDSFIALIGGKPHVSMCTRLCVCTYHLAKF